MSFLGNFTVQIDKAKAELRLAQVDSGDSPAKAGKSKSGAGKSKTGAAKSKAGNSSKSKKKTDDDG